MSAPIQSRSFRASRSALAEYPRVEGVYDELRDGDGRIRGPYRPLIEKLDRLTLRERRQRELATARLIEEQGITYTIHGDPRGHDRPWQLDPFPFVLGESEWRNLEAGLIQRATLLDRVLADCHGPQELLHSGFLPPALVWGQPDFLRPVVGAQTPQNRYLHFYAADLARAPDGRWWVISDRTQIPTGVGYALANRIVTSRVFPEVFRTSNVLRLADYFGQTRQMLESLASRRTDNPRVVILTPGPYNETYYEQVYLARYLGYTLVEGQDLTVRENRVFLKTLSGLEPVDVILRRLDDDFCDPLELRNDSMLGVPGLVDAVRAGNVAVTNALGSGLVQSPAFLAFLPGLARRVLGEDLRLPSVATWWCGQESAMQYVLDHLEPLYVKPAFRSHRSGFAFKPRFNDLERDELRAKLRFNPYAYVGQEWVRLSRTPVLHQGAVEARKVGLRVYLVATEDGSYRAMPGGLARIVTSERGDFISMQRGSSTKDVWITSDEEVKESTLIPSRAHTLKLRRTGNNLPSRVADNFFWLGRYAERLDACARILRSVCVRLGPENSSATLAFLTPLLRSLEYQELIEPRKGALRWTDDPERLEAELLDGIFKAKLPSSLVSQAARLEQLAAFVRERTSLDVWRTLNELPDKLKRPSKITAFVGDVLPVLNETIATLGAFNGLAEENMTRTQAWRFLDMGRRLERATVLTHFCAQALRGADADNPSRLELVLETADSTITYRNRYNLLPDIAAVFDLVLLDQSNPRALLFQLLRLQDHFAALPQESDAHLSPGQRLLLEASHRLQLFDPYSLYDLRGAGVRHDALRLLDQTETDLPRLSDALTAAYFSHSSLSRTGRSR
jgi:uncharacterized circularly permuted ATP-grasp superfamily protein/uncharacterized alpha-E superfamily protein